MVQSFGIQPNTHELSNQILALLFVFGHKLNTSIYAQIFFSPNIGHCSIESMCLVLTAGAESAGELAACNGPFGRPIAAHRKRRAAVVRPREGGSSSAFFFFCFQVLFFPSPKLFLDHLNTLFLDFIIYMYFI